MSQDVSWNIWVGVFATIIPATILVAVRFLARTHGPLLPLKVGLKADDWLILASLVSKMPSLSLPSKSHEPAFR